MGSILNELEQRDLKGEFSKRHNALSAPNSLVNYIWVNPIPVNAEKMSLWGIPSGQLHRALNNVEKYPDTDFNLWLDFKTLDEQVQNSLKENPTPFVFKNLKIRDLQDISSYRDHELTSEDAPIAVCSDITRLFVLSHCFQEKDFENYTDIFYSDLDCKDIRIQDPELQNIMNIYGLNLGMYHSEELDRLNYENGYMGVRRGFGSWYLNEYIIPASLEHMVQEEGYNTSDTPVLMSFFELQRIMKMKERYGIEVLEECGAETEDVSDSLIYDRFS